MLSNRIFEDLFVLELANNHWGSVERGIRIIRDFGTVARYNDVRAAIKLQFRDVDSFIHPNWRGDQSLRYIKKTEATRLTAEQLTTLIREIRNVGCIPMATPFDEASVALCAQLDLPIIKVASSDINDWPLLEAIAHTRRPVIISSGGAALKSLDDVVTFFGNRRIPLAINHCVSLYPSEDSELELNQIDFLRERYPDHVIGFSTHEYHSWDASMFISYAKGARTWERHIDIDADGIDVAPYCSLPEQIDTWFKSYWQAVSMCGGSPAGRRVLPGREVEYLDALVRGVYARQDLDAGMSLSREAIEEFFYLAVPLQKGQLSSREVVNGELLVRPLLKDEPLTIDHIDGPYSESPALRDLIINRGV